MTSNGDPLDPALAQAAGVDPGELATAVRVLQQLHHLPDDHPDIRTIKHAASHMYKALKQERRTRKREAELAADRAVTEATATGSPMRIDDETLGIPLVSTAPGAFAGELINPRGCYICKNDYTLVDAFYHWLCPTCAARSHTKRDQGTDLTGRRALLTGGRAKIGMYIALRLLRDGAHTTITTRFPHDAVRRFVALDDSGDWIHRLKIVGIDLRDPTQVVGLADEVAAAGPLDILINNAAQTVRRSPGAYSQLVELESAPLPAGIELPELVTFDRISEAHPAAIAGTLTEHAVAHHEGEPVEHALAARTAASMTALALSAGSASLEAHLAGTAVDAGGLLPDLQTTNSWTQTVDEVDPLELLEVQLCNSVAPFVLISRLRPAMRAAVEVGGARRAHVVNVSAMEGQFSRTYKGPGHPHTNMAKAALNMLTRTSAGEMFEADRILMNAVDTGWITDERPHQEKLRIAAEGWHAPLDLVDGAARVYDPIVRGEAGEDLHGHFLKDYEPSPW
ncbi:SDR family NAD(P)-dependent oxidoreductase [Nocardioides sp.]|uniref:SDR family NAD(P)-dependent oxidoreductase n=1 Tax=Nocardioides sp. TaxID=35761 RepID=UPI0031FE6865|nr:short-chain dehydrogenase [Nocardioides sp.]